MLNQVQLPLLLLANYVPIKQLISQLRLLLEFEQIDSVQWIFQNNGTSKESNPEKLFSTNGEFEVTQIAYASNECKDTINQTITIPQTVSLPQTNILSPSQGEKIFENAVLLSWTAEDAISYSVGVSVDSEFSTSTISEIHTNQYLEYDISSITKTVYGGE
ncbi:MAG: hypothetical protein IPO21_01300 [Bacteroidales bacterium]|nr:hypothetical protein [Bacteroidales bacterium]